MYERIFRTFCNGYGKAPSELSLKPEHIRTWDECQDLRDFGGLLRPDFIDVSVDDPKMTERLLAMVKANHWKTLILENPSNEHAHSYWKMPKKWTNGADKTLACGFIADIHSGGTYIPIRVNDVTRECVYDIGPKDEYQELPEELWPIEPKGKAPLPKLWQMKESKRNDTLFKYILTLCRNHIGDEDHEIARRVIRNINWFVFAESLPDDEIENIIREDAFPTLDEIRAADYFGGKNDRTFLHAKMADDMIKNCHIERVNGQLWIYQPDEGIYTSNIRYFQNVMKQYVSKITGAQRTEVLNYIDISLPEDTLNADGMTDYIAFENGVYNIRTNEMMETSPELFITNKIPWNYNPWDHTESDLAADAVNGWACGDENIIKLLGECIGYCFYRKSDFKKSFILTGSGNNGKSTYLDVLKGILGKKNYSALDIGELDDRFSTAMISGKLANIGDDISSDFLQGKTLSIFKKVVAGNTIKAEEKGMLPFNFEPYAKLLFSANEIPRMKTKGFDAIKNRLIIIPFDAKFQPGGSGFHYGLAYQITHDRAAMEWFVRFGMDGLKRILQQGFTQSQKVDEQIELFEKDNNPLMGWLDEVKEDRDDDPRKAMLREPVTMLYEKYDGYCRKNGFKPMSVISFGKEVESKFNFSPRRARRKVGNQKLSFFKD